MAFLTRNTTCGGLSHDRDRGEHGDVTLDTPMGPVLRSRNWSESAAWPTADALGSELLQVRD